MKYLLFMKFKTYFFYYVPRCLIMSDSKVSYKCRGSNCSVKAGSVREITMHEYKCAEYRKCEAAFSKKIATRIYRCRIWGCRVTKTTKEEIVSHQRHEHRREKSEKIRGPPMGAAAAPHEAKIDPTDEVDISKTVDDVDEEITSSTYMFRIKVEANGENYDGYDSDPGEITYHKSNHFYKVAMKIPSDMDVNTAKKNVYEEIKGIVANIYTHYVPFNFKQVQATTTVSKQTPVICEDEDKCNIIVTIDEDDNISSKWNNQAPHKNTKKITITKEVVDSSSGEVSE